MLFKSDLKELAPLILVPDHKEVPQFYRADMEFAREMSKDSQAMQLLLNQIELITCNDGFKYTSIDARTHMLMKGMYPCIPGWHCDDFYRPTNDQPALDTVENEAPQQHYLICLGNVSLTEFLNDDFHGPTPQQVKEIDGADKPVYYHYDHYVERLIERCKVEEGHNPVISVKENTIYSFGPLAFHRGMPANANGWRTFIRVTRSNHRAAKNEIRYQSNVYIKGDISW